MWGYSKPDVICLCNLWVPELSSRSRQLPPHDEQSLCTGCVRSATSRCPLSGPCTFKLLSLSLRIVFTLFTDCYHSVYWWWIPLRSWKFLYDSCTMPTFLSKTRTRECHLECDVTETKTKMAIYTPPKRHLIDRCHCCALSDMARLRSGTAILVI